MRNIFIFCLIIIGGCFVFVYSQNASNGRYQFISNQDFQVESGTVVMDTQDGTIYHIVMGELKSFNPITAQRKNWRIDSNGIFTIIHDGY